MLQRVRHALKNRKGFTLVELMVVVVIIGILAGIAVPTYNNITEKAEQSAVEANLRTIDSAIMMYRAEKAELPDDVTPVVTDTTLQDYLQSWPTGPGTAIYGISSGRAIVDAPDPGVGGKILDDDTLEDLPWRSGS